MTLMTRRSVFIPHPRSRAKIDLARHHALATAFHSRYEPVPLSRTVVAQTDT